MNIHELNLRLNELRHPILAEGHRYRVDGRRRMKDPGQIADFSYSVLGLKDAAEEYLYAFAFDTGNHLLGFFELCHGTVNLCFTTPREVMQKLFLLGAAYFVLVHNHPGGDPSPSPSDISITKHLYIAGELMSLPLVDHVVIGRGENVDCRYYSFAEGGMIVEWAERIESDA